MVFVARLGGGCRYVAGYDGAVGPGAARAALTVSRRVTEPQAVQWVASGETPWAHAICLPGDARSVASRYLTAVTAWMITAYTRCH
jgi:hypothetical protein